MRPRHQRLTAALAALALIVAASRPVAAQGTLPGARLGARWPVKTREHVDLWLHAFALISADTATVPLYKRGYRDAMLVARNAANAYTDLDVNADALRTTLGNRPNLLSAQFLALQFGTWAEMDAAFDAFVKSDGNVRGNDFAARQVAAFAAVFRTREEREFARKFLIGIRSEREKFHHQWWVAETRKRDAALAAVDSTWQNSVRPRLQSFLDHVQQSDGQILLSTVLEGEGRTMGTDKRDNTITCGFPETPERAMDAIDCVLHELVGPIAAAAVEDNVTPAQKRSGAADQLQSLALVRGGAQLAAKLGATYAAGYMAFYLRAAGKEPGADPAAAFAAAFPIPEPVLASMERQIAVAFGGI